MAYDYRSLAFIDLPISCIQDAILTAFGEHFVHTQTHIYNQRLKSCLQSSKIALYIINAEWRHEMCREWSAGLSQIPNIRSSNE